MSIISYQLSAISYQLSAIRHNLTLKTFQNIFILIALALFTLAGAAHAESEFSCFCALDMVMRGHNS